MRGGRKPSPLRGSGTPSCHRRNRRSTVYFLNLFLRPPSRRPMPAGALFHAPEGLTMADAKKMSGADILVQCLIRHGTEAVFAYPGGASMPLHQSLTHVADKIRTILPRHEQG